MPEPERIYWDSDPFISYLGKQDEDDRLVRCEATLAQAEAGNIVIVCSALALAEVVKLKKRTPLPREHEAKVIDFFANEWIIVHTVDRRIAEEARELVWRGGIDPKDAVHVATALRVKAVALETFDTGLLKKSLTVGSPPLVIRKPLGPLSVGLYACDG